MGIDEHAFQRTSEGDGYFDPAYANRDQRAKLQKFKPDRSGGGVRKLHTLQRQAAQRRDEHIGCARKP